MGFGTHPHREMEIITYVISGEIRHQERMGNIGFIKPGEIQIMSAGTGITHSEHNNKKTEETHLLQIWVLPNSPGLTPRYDQKIIFEQNEFNFLKVIAAPFSEPTTAASLNANAKFWLGRFNHSEQLTFKPTSYTHYWLQLIKGNIKVNHESFQAGDAIAFSNNEECVLVIEERGAEFLIIEVASN